MRKIIEHLLILTPTLVLAALVSINFYINSLPFRTTTAFATDVTHEDVVDHVTVISAELYNEHKAAINSKMDRAGDTMTGNLDMDDNDLDNVGDVDAANGIFSGSVTIGDSNAYASRTTATYATLAAITGMSDGDEVYVEGRAADGDGGEGVFYYDDDSGETAVTGMIIDAAGAGDGRWIRKHSGHVNLLWFGATGDGITNDRTALYEWLSYGISSGETLYAPPGDYLQSTAISLTTSKDLEIVMDIGATIIGGAYDDSIWKIYGNTSNTYKFKLLGGNFDNSGTTYVPGSGSGTCLSLTRLREVDISGTHFEAEANYQDSQDNSHGDAGITIKECYDVSINKCTFIGQPDVGIYITGEATTDRTDDGGEYLVTGNHFRYNGAGVTVKRQCKNVVIANNTFYRDRVGIATSDTSGPLPPGETVLIANNIFKFIGTRAIQLRLGKGSKVVGNIIEDWGYDLTDTITTFLSAIMLNGASDGTIEHNIIRMEDWSDSNHNGIEINDDEYDSTDYNSINNIIQHNHISNVTTGIKEATTDCENDYIFNTFDNVTNPHSLQDADSFYCSSGGDTVRINKDSDTVTNAGVVLKKDGRINATTDGDSAIGLNRLSSYGNLAVFYKDSVAKGAISLNETKDKALFNGGVYAVDGGVMVSSGYDEDHLEMGDYGIWVDTTGKLRIVFGAPSSDTDGTIVGSVTGNLTVGDNSDSDFSVTFDSDTDDLVFNWDEANSEVEMDAPNYRFGANADEDIVIVLDSDTNDATITYDEANDELEVSSSVVFSKQAIFSSETETCAAEAGTADPTVVITFIVSDGDADTDEDTVSLADGTAVGQQKIFVFKTDTDTGDSVNVTPSNGSFTDILFEDVGDGCTMVWDGTNWHIISNNGGTIT